MEGNPNHAQLVIEFHLAQNQCSNRPGTLKLFVLALVKGLLNLEGFLTNLLACLAGWTSRNTTIAY